MAAISPFIHLRIRSVYSLLEGAIHLKKLVKWCEKESMPAIAIADRANLFGSLEFSMEATKSGVQPIHAMIALLKPEEETDGKPGFNRKPDQLLLIAQNEQGWQNLLELTSRSYLSPDSGEAPLLTYAELEGRTDGLIALTGGVYGTVGKLLLTGRKEAADEALQQLMKFFPERLYVELMRHGMMEEQQTEGDFIELALKHNLPLVATNDVYFLNEEMFEAHDAFLCIADGTYVGEINRRRLTPHHRLKTPAEMVKLFSDLPEAIENTHVIAKRCSFYSDKRAPMLPRFSDESGRSEEELLREQALDGLKARLEKHVFTEGMDEAAREERAKPYFERLEFELGIIIKMRFPGYFLIVSDFIKWSKAHDIPVGPGRGSGAGSLVAWSLSITDLDPLRYGLLFERFLNPERVSMPDFDVDFCQDRREEVINYVQQRYGADRVAQIITFGKLQARAALRDVGRVLQMPYGQVDKICRLVPNNPANPVTLEEAIDMEPMFKAAIKENETVEKLIDVSLKVEGLNRHASTHAAGVVIADRPLYELVPMYRDPKSDMPVVQYSMKYAEAAGLVKFDFLGLKTLTVLMEAVKMMKDRGVKVDLLKLPEGDKPTYEMLGNGDSIGVFQLESAGMRDTLRKLKPDTLEDIIALVSLYRPGPMNNIPTYIARKHGEEKPEYLHPLIEPILKETFGVIIYQEQVMQIAQVLAGYSLGEADLLRRAMGKKIRSEMEAQRSIFVERSVKNKVPEKQAAAIFDLIAKFAEYGFNKSHAAAYALIAYQTAYLKANAPREFMAATMTYDMHNTDKLGIFRAEAEGMGIALLPPDINHSQVRFSVEGESIRYALAAIRNVGAQAMEALVAEREANGKFIDILDFAQRVSAEVLNRRALEHLIKAGAFDSLEPNRRMLMENLDLIIAYATQQQRERESNQVSLFGEASGADAPKPALAQFNDWPSMEKLEHEFSAIGFYLSAHPLQAYTEVLEKLRVTTSAQFASRLDGAYSPLRIAGIVTGRKFKASPKGRFAFIQLSDGDGVFEASIFNDALLSSARDHLEPGKMLFMQVDGKMEEAGPRLIVTSISLLEDEAIRQQKADDMTLHISVVDKNAIAPLQQVLGAASQAGTRICLNAKYDGKTARIELAGRYIISPAILDRVRAIEGIAEAA